jgi:hypothetical protein
MSKYNKILCVSCSRALKLDPYAIIGVKRYGYGGNGVVCTLTCGYKLAMRLLEAVPNALDLLPPDWRGDKKKEVKPIKYLKI